MQNKSCIFCKIGAGKVPSHKVFENDSSLAFLDIKPHCKGHTVVIPKKHGETVFDFDDEDLRILIVDVRRVMEKLQDKLNPDGFNVGWNHNSAAGQVVPHLHVHIMPRWSGDGGGSMHSIISDDVKVEDVVELFK